mmetsp:Transcript_1406/g.4254  ORF Transcript_1406/g.4254 Transcript_1406/m.4254 type:complete len:305 (+) Transcript_1406:1338-2252(+)
MCESRHTVIMGQVGRYFEMSRAEVPVVVSVRMRRAACECAASTTALATDSFIDSGFGIVSVICSVSRRMKMAASASLHTRSIMATASRGYAPLAVSPDSITQSAPSSTALATSDASARVGRGLLVIDSSICVAQMQGLPATLHFAIIIFCARNTFSDGISMPRSPRATMTPSVAARISSKLRIPSWFSILEMIRIRLPTTGSAATRHARTSCTSDALRMKEANTMSTSLETAKARSSRSLADSAGRSTSTSGRLHPFLEPSSPELTTSHSSVPAAASIAATLSAMSPSSTKITPPTDITLGRFA